MKVIIYSTSDCAPCRTLKYWLNKNNVEYEERSTVGTKYRIAPTTVIGEHTITGLNIPRIKEVLEIGN